MTIAQFASRLHSEDVIIVRGGVNAALRVPALVRMGARTDAERIGSQKPRKLLREVVASRMAGKRN